MLFEYCCGCMNVVMWFLLLLVIKLCVGLDGMFWFMILCRFMLWLGWLGLENIMLDLLMVRFQNGLVLLYFRFCGNVVGCYVLFCFFKKCSVIQLVCLFRLILFYLLVVLCIISLIFLVFEGSVVMILVLLFGDWWMFSVFYVLMMVIL